MAPPSKEKMPRYERHIFICINQRPPEDLRGCCAAKGSEKIVEAFKEEIKKQGLKGKIRVNKAGCLDQCSKGASVVIYPEGVWYGHVQLGDVSEIVRSHLVGGEPVRRLRTD